MAGKITGINHLVLICKNMEETLRFYRDLLGLRVKATMSSADGRHAQRAAATGGAVAMAVVERTGLDRLYFLEAPDGTMITLAELPSKDVTSQRSLFLPNYWPGAGDPPENPQGLDHLAFNVDSRDELVWFQSHLRDHGITVSEIEERPSNPKFVRSIYFSDPNGIPLEVATWDWDDPAWKTVKDEDFFTDPDPLLGLPHPVKRNGASS